MHALLRFLGIGIGCLSLGLNGPLDQRSPCPSVPPTEWGSLQSWQEQLYREEIFAECSFFLKSSITRVSSPSSSTSPASVPQVGSQVTPPSTLTNGTVARVPTDFERLQGLENSQNPRISEVNRTPGVQITPVRSSGEKFDWDMESVKRYLAFYGPSFFKKTETSSFGLAPVLVWIQSPGDCAACKEGMEVVKSWVMLSFQRRGLLPVWLKETEFPHLLSGVPTEEAFWAQVKARQALGGLWVEWPATVSNDGSADEETLPGNWTGSASEVRPLLRLVFLLRAQKRDENLIQNIPKSSTSASSPPVALPEGVLQVRPAPCELLGVEGIRPTLRRFLMEVWMELGAQFEKVEQKAKSLERPKEVFVTLSGFRNFSQYSRAQALIQAEWSRVCESLKFLGVESAPTLVLQELTQGQAVWVASFPGLLNPVKSADPAAITGVSPGIRSTQWIQQTTGDILKKQFHVSDSFQPDGGWEVKLAIP